MEAKALSPITLFDMTGFHQAFFFSLRESRTLSCRFRSLLLSAELAVIYVQQNASQLYCVQGFSALPPMICSTPPQVDECLYITVSTYRNSEVLEKKSHWLFTSVVLPRPFTISLLQQVLSTLFGWVAQLFGKDPKKDGDKSKPEKQKPGTQPEKKKGKPEREGGRDPREPRQPKTRSILTFLQSLALSFLSWLY